MGTTWTKRTKISTSFTSRTKPVDIWQWLNMTMTWAEATKQWQHYSDYFLRREKISTTFTKRIIP